ncbi:MAG: glycosyltransferase family 8 protein [Chthoniobacteraceae bacterium]
MTPHVVICTASNETYVLGAAAALVSAILNAPEAVDIRVYVLDGGMKERSWRKLQTSLERLPRPCEVIRLLPNMQTFAGLPQDWGSSVMTYARLALPKMVDEERILYVDADMIVQKPWREIWETDLGEAIVAAAPDIVTKTLADEKLDLEKFQLDPQASYFQAGLLLIDLCRWRDFGVSTKVLAYLCENPGHCRYWDQSALNVVLYRLWKPLPMAWNTPAWWADQGRENCQLDAPVLHFVGPHKPWLHGHDGNSSAVRFYGYVDRTRWKGWRPTSLRFACKMAKYRLGLAIAKARGLIKKD